jgi:hypothetical protein
MAIFQPGDGYRDPSKALSIKALQERQKLAAERLANANVTEAPMISPWQGAAQLGGVLSGIVGQRRADAAEGDARMRLSEIMAGIDPEKGATQQQYAEMRVLDPEMADRQYEAAMQERWKVANREDDQSFRAGESQADRDARIAEQSNRQTFERNQQTERLAAEKSNIGYKDTLEDEDTRLANEAAAKKARLDAALSTNEGKRAELVAAGQMDAATADQLNQADRVKLTSEIEGTQAQTAATVAGVGRPVTDEDAKNYPKLADPEVRKQYQMVDGAPKLIDPVQKPGDFMTPGQTAVDQEFGKNIRDIRAAGSTGAVKTAAQVNKAIQLLESGDITGLRQGLIANTLPSFVSGYLQPGTTIAQSAIRESVAESLRQTLGSQFTEKEGVNLMERAFDPTLDEKENIRRAKLLLNQLTENANVNQSMLDYWDTHNGSLVGYSGPTNSVDVMATLRSLAESTTAPDETAPPPPADAPDETAPPPPADAGGWTVKLKGT